MKSSEDPFLSYSIRCRTCGRDIKYEGGRSCPSCKTKVIDVVRDNKVTILKKRKKRSGRRTSEKVGWLRAKKRMLLGILILVAVAAPNVYVYRLAGNQKQDSRGIKNEIGLPSMDLSFHGPDALLDKNILRLIGKNNPRFSLTRMANSQRQSAITRVANGYVSFAITHESVTVQQQKMFKEANPTKELRQTRIGSDAIIVYSHEYNNVRDITVEDVFNVYSGNIGIWSKLGGANNHVIPVLLSGAGRNGIFYELVSMSPKTKYVETHQEMFDFVRKTPGAVGYEIASTFRERDDWKGVDPVRIDGIPPIVDREINPELGQSNYGLTVPVSIVYRVTNLNFNSTESDWLGQSVDKGGEMFALYLAGTADGQKVVEGMGYWSLFRTVRKGGYSKPWGSP